MTKVYGRGVVVEVRNRDTWWSLRRMMPDFDCDWSESRSATRSAFESAEAVKRNVTMTVKRRR